jgi:hypothetical protein
MDAIRFDQLIKRIGTTRISRFTALRGLAVGALAATIGLADPDDAAAKCKKKCGQCQKKTRKKTKSGKVRCRCKPKANGTLCSIPGATTTTTCLNGTCVAAAGPVVECQNNAGCTAGRVCENNRCVDCTSTAQCSGNLTCINGRCQSPPAFDCRQPGVGCTGQFAGLVCDPATGQCLFCTSFTQCGSISGAGSRACINGFCTGGQACTNNPECVFPQRCLNPPGAIDLQDVCLTDNECRANFGSTGTGVCPEDLPLCVAGDCTTACVEFGNCGGGTRFCEGGVCINFV